MSQEYSNFCQHWHIPLGRRFRSLKLWFLLRCYGVEGLKEYIRRHVRLAHHFKDHLLADGRFDLVAEVKMGLVCFRLKQDNQLTEKLHHELDADGRIHLVSSSFHHPEQIYFLRFAVCYQHADEDQIDYSFNVIKEMADKNKLSSSQKNALSEFRTVTRCSEDKAIGYLQSLKWNLQSALNEFFSSGRAMNTVDENKIEQLFNQYRDKDCPTRILKTGMVRFISQDLKIDLTNVMALIIAWKFNAKTQGEFTKEEFMEGMLNLDCDSVESLRAKLPGIEKNTMENIDNYKSLYHYAFSFANAENPLAKNLGLDEAIAYWTLLLSGRYMHLDLWFKFLQEKHKKPVSQDTWKLFFEFVQITDPKFDNFDMNGAWPYLIDAFVEYAKPVVNPDGGNSMDTL
ncbi:DCN1-like protein 1 [Cichlidogyrus casuarinus]|uniref:Defective in cullin neddylation protein n=1 Tax=Cichlidogyrus casuarinus TaxID=1844966 RepID=A0ABD2PMF6_9PLAT